MRCCSGRCRIPTPIVSPWSSRRPANNPVGGDNVSAPNFLDWRRQNDVFERMALYEYLGFNLSDGDDPEQVGALRVTGGVFDLLGVAPMLGRGLIPPTMTDPMARSSC